MGKMLDSFDEILLFPGESAEDLTTLQTNWAKDFPGTSFTLTTLRQDLIRADWNRRRAQRLLTQIHTDLLSTTLPETHWDPITRRHLHYFEKNRASTQKEFRQAFQFLHSCKPAPKPPEIEPEPKPESKPELCTKYTINQHVYVSVSPEGEVITRVDPDSARLLTPGVVEYAGEYSRNFHFKDSIVPEPYHFVLVDEGLTYAPAGTISLIYTIQQFQDLCRLEMETEPPRLLDGERDNYNHPDIPRLLPGSSVSLPPELPVD